MSIAESAARGRVLLDERVQVAPDFVARVPLQIEALMKRPTILPRTLVTTGLGTSEGHARHLAEVAVRWTGQPARFASTGSLAGGAPPGAEADWLVVFSQGLSANARHALSDVAGWGGVVLVTGLGGSAESIEALPQEKRDWLVALDRQGVVRVDLGCGTEYGMLLRVIGARVGYAVAWSLLRTLAARRLAADGLPAIDLADLRAAQSGARARLEETFARDESLAGFFAAERPLILVGEGGLLDLAEQLSLKIAEGMLRPQPRCVDVLGFAHGPLQSLASRPASILYLAKVGADAKVEPDTPVEAKTDGPTTDWLARFRATLDPALHDLRILEARLPLPYAVLEYEALLDECVLRVLEETGADLVDWPGSDREAALYGASPRLDALPASSLSMTDAEAQAQPSALRPLEEAVWPDVEGWVESGRRTALVALGSIEQHGPHLPLGTDHWIAQALVDGLASRLEDAVALPAIAFGCASEHLDFPGTLHVEPATLEATLRDLLVSARRHGFERAFVFTAHGGNVDALRAMQERLALDVAPLALRIELDLRVAAMQSDAVVAESLDPRSAGPHAGEYETSVVAMLRSGSVRGDRLATGRVIERGEGQGLFYPSLRPNTASGVLGDPSRASASRGRAYLEAWLDLLVDAYRNAFSGVAEKKRQ